MLLGGDVAGRGGRGGGEMLLRPKEKTMGKGIAVVRPKRDSATVRVLHQKASYTNIIEL